MKEGTENSVKFKRLKRRLGLPEWQAIGLLESIWKLTRVSAPAGDIGRFSNEDIAASIEYLGDADELIENLVDCGWLDECETSRLVVNDWEAIYRARRQPIGRRRDLGTAAWKAIRLMVIEEDGAICRYCGEDCSHDPTVDHVVPFAFGGGMERDNLVVACRSCNGRKGDRSA